jgi:hypothetical protein
MGLFHVFVRLVSLSFVLDCWYFGMLPHHHVQPYQSRSRLIVCSFFTLLSASGHANVHYNSIAQWHIYTSLQRGNPAPALSSSSSFSFIWFVVGTSSGVNDGQQHQQSPPLPSLSNTNRDTHPHNTAKSTGRSSRNNREEPLSLLLQEPTRRPKPTHIATTMLQSTEGIDDDNDDEGDVILLDYDTTTTSSPLLDSITDDNTKEYTPETTTNTTTSNSDALLVQASDVIVLALVDGTLVGLSRSTGRTIWKHPLTVSSSSSLSLYTTTTTDTNNYNSHPLVKPLVSTTTTISSSNRHPHQQQQQQYPFRNTMAVPSILDGKVYLTSTLEDCSNFMKHSPTRHIDNDDDNEYEVDENTGQYDTATYVCDLVEDTVTTTIHNLMEQTPFVDQKNHGRIYTSQRHSVAVAIHSTTGQPIRTITTTTATASKTPKESSSSLTDPLVAIREVSNLRNENEDDGDTDTTKTTTTTTTTDKNKNHQNDSNKEDEDDILWLGRTDYTISVHEPMTGVLDVQFTMAEMMSIHDMLLIEENHHHIRTWWTWYGGV